MDRELDYHTAKSEHPAPDFDDGVRAVFDQSEDVDEFDAVNTRELPPPSLLYRLRAFCAEVWRLVRDCWPWGAR